MPERLMMLVMQITYTNTEVKPLNCNSNVNLIKYFRNLPPKHAQIKLKKSIYV
jgi:hypothetical protein